jgi:hypothetical protein
MLIQSEDGTYTDTWHRKSPAQTGAAPAAPLSF